MKSALSPSVSSFVSVQEAPTPTISNRAAPKHVVPPPLELPAQTPSSTKDPLSSLPSENGYYNTGTPLRQPRFSSPTSQPIIVHRSLYEPTSPTIHFGSIQNNHHPMHPHQKDRRMKNNHLYSSNNNSFDYPLEPTLACSAGDFSLNLLLAERSHDPTYSIMEWTFQIIPFLVTCDFFKAQAPYWRLLQQSLSAILQSLTTQWQVQSQHPKQRRRMMMNLYDSTTTYKNNHNAASSDGKRIIIRGIPNYGETCFLNAVLQSLAALEPFLGYLECILKLQEEIPRPIPEKDIDNDNNTKKNNSDQMDEEKPQFSRQVLEFLQAINGNSSSHITNNQSQRSHHNNTTLDPRPLLKRIGETNSQFKNFRTRMEQQDAQELLQALLGAIITDAQLDSTPSDQMRFRQDHIVEHHFYESSDDDENLTAAVIAVDQQQPNLSSTMSSIHVSLGGTTTTGSSRDSALSLCSLLQKIDKEQRAILQQRKSLSKEDETTSSTSTSTIPVSEVDDEDRLNQREEKKQEDFEVSLPCAASEEDLECLREQHSSSEVIHQRMDDSTISDTMTDDCTTDDDNNNINSQGGFFVGEDVQSKLSTSMHIMKTTISSITPSPLSGWLGSTLRCCVCKHVRPIQNAPFLDIPVVPTSVPAYLAHARYPSKPRAPNISPLPACSLDQCLADFTSVERVQDVECRNCTIQQELKQLEEERDLLEGAIASTEKRISRRGGGDPSDQTKYLKHDLEKVATRLFELQTVDPDDEEVPLFWDESLAHNSKAIIEDLPAAGDQQQTKQRLERCDAEKCLLLTRCPSILCCHVQRRYYDPFTNRMEKCIQFVEFPQILDLSPYCAYSPRAATPWAAGSLKPHCEQPLERAQGKIPYRLQSIIEHRGNANGGHYISYRRNQGGEWFRISDNNVTPISWRQVRTCQAYMLFYEAV